MVLAVVSKDGVGRILAEPQFLIPLVIAGPCGMALLHAVVLSVASLKRLGIQYNNLHLG